MAKATNGKDIRPWKDENGNTSWVTLIDRNDHHVERQLYVDDDGIDYLSLGGFFFDRLVLEETFGMRVCPYKRDEWGNVI